MATVQSTLSRAPVQDNVDLHPPHASPSQPRPHTPEL